MRNTVSTSSHLASGGPQGSTLGPILFSACISPIGKLAADYNSITNSMLMTLSCPSHCLHQIPLHLGHSSKPAFCSYTSGFVGMVFALTLTSPTPSYLVSANGLQLYQRSHLYVSRALSSLSQTAAFP
jgi:hypothetical protein